MIPASLSYGGRTKSEAVFSVARDISVAVIVSVVLGKATALHCLFFIERLAEFENGQIESLPRRRIFFSIYFTRADQH